MLSKLRDLLRFGDEFSTYDKVLLPTTRERLEVVAGDGANIKVRKKGEERWVLDATSQVGTNPFGHRDPDMMQAMREFYDSETPLMTAGNDIHHPLQRDLAEKFTEIFPGDLRPGQLKTYFCNSGSEAVERGCLKASQLHKGGNTYMACWGAFHGRTSLALSCNFSKGVHTEGYNSLFRTLPVPFARPSDDIDAVMTEIRDAVVREGAGNINALIVEPIQGEGGYVVPHDEFLPRIRELTTAHDIPLIMDEVQASLRTGEWFACENWEVQPDMIPVAKAFSGGISPFGASLIRSEYATDQEGKHSSTFGGNPKECYTALKTIEIIQEKNYLLNAKQHGAYLDKQWAELTDHDGITEVRGIGLMRGIEFTEKKQRDAVLQRLFDEYDVWTMGCGNDAIDPAIRFLLPINISRSDVETLSDSVIQACEDVLGRS